jgi:hypothetical protein
MNIQLLQSLVPENLQMERVTGPCEGVYIAAYTAELDGLFYGYAKLCASQPVDVWAVQAIWKLTAARGYVDEIDALQAVEALALRSITELRAPLNEGFWQRLVARAPRRR